MNLSEGRDTAVIAALAGCAGSDLLDVHSDPWHHRSVLTMVGEEAPRAVAAAAIERLDLAAHDGVHPRFGVVDVVPFVPLRTLVIGDALAARDRFAEWAGREGVPCFLYGPERSLPEVRRGAFTAFGPDTGPAAPHPTAGAIAVGARPVLVAYNLWLADAEIDAARAIVRGLRGPAVRALAFEVGDAVQVSTNLLDPAEVTPADVYDRVASRATIARAELVGLVPTAVLERVPSERWAELDLSPERTIEARLGTRLD